MNRFQKIYQQGTIDVIEIWLDTETGVQYLFHKNGNAGALPLCWIGKGSRSCDFPPGALQRKQGFSVHPRQGRAHKK